MSLTTESITVPQYFQFQFRFEHSAVNREASSLADSLTHRLALGSFHFFLKISDFLITPTSAKDDPNELKPHLSQVNVYFTRETSTLVTRILSTDGNHSFTF